MTPSIRPQGDFGATVGRCFGLMIAAKRPIEPPSSPQVLQSKRSKADNDAASSTSITSSMSNTASDSVARQFLLSDQHHRVRIYTQFSEVSFFRGLPWLSVAAVSYMEVITVNYSPPPPPELPKKVPFHLNEVFSACSRAAKMAWIAETGLVEFPHEDLSDEDLGKLYKVAHRKLARHQKNPQALRASSSTPNPPQSTFPTPRATPEQMKYQINLNANQLRSFDKQVAEGTP